MIWSTCDIYFCLLMFNHAYLYLCLLMIRMYLLYYFVDLSLVRVRFGIRLDAYNFSLKHVIREIFKETITVLMNAIRQNKQYHDFMSLTDHSQAIFDF